MFRCICVLSLGLLCAAPVLGQEKKPPRDTASYPHQLRIGIDLSRPILHALAPVRYSYEVQADYAFRKEIYGVLEGGYGAYKANYTDLSYQSSNPFVRIGFDRGVLRRLFPGDWDGGVFGLRYGFAQAQRSAASYSVGNSIWGFTNGAEAARSFSFHWIELTGGIRLELAKGIFTGWNIRGKFMITNLNTGDLRPSYVAGFGQADNSTGFDFNVWVLYAMRWGRK